MDIFVEYLNHSGYVVETSNCVLVFDYVNGILPRHYLDSEKPVVFFVTHSHGDHYDPSIFKYKKDVVVSEDVKVPIREHAIVVKPNDSLMINGAKIRVFSSTDLGVSYYVEAGNACIFHAGDLNNWHWKEESSEDEIELATFRFLNIIEDLKGLPVDVAMFPVDPRLKKDFDQGARTYIDTIKPKWFFPMHFAHAADLEPFAEWISQKSHIKYEIPIDDNTKYVCEI